jgi:hypothetical protein
LFIKNFNSRNNNNINSRHLQLESHFQIISRKEVTGNSGTFCITLFLPYLLFRKHIDRWAGDYKDIPDRIPVIKESFLLMRKIYEQSLTEKKLNTNECMKISARKG